jgi:hypothetical protein
VLVETLKNECYRDLRDIAEETLVKIGKPAVPALIDALKGGDSRAQKNADRALGKILNNSKTAQELREFETKLQEGYEKLRKRCKERDELPDAQMKISQLRIAASVKRNQLSEDKGILLDYKPKPPKKGGMYQQLRRVRNG